MERQMASLLYTCPETRQQTPTGIEIDARSLRWAWSEKVRVQCPCCGNMHQLPVRETYIDGALHDARPGSATCVAISECVPQAVE